MGGRQADTKLDFRRAFRQQRPLKLKADGEEGKDEKPFVGSFVPHIRDALIGYGVVFFVVEQYVLAERRRRIALTQTGHKGFVNGFDLLIPVVDTD